MSGRITKQLRWLLQHVGFKKARCLIWPFGLEVNGRARLRVNGVRWQAHRLMCILAHGEPPTPEHHAAHVCGRGHMGCINPVHLAWKTPLENQADRELHGTKCEGEGHPRAKITAETVLEILALDGVMLQKDIAVKFGVDKGTVSNIMTGRQWASVTGVEHGQRTRH